MKLRQHIISLLPALLISLIFVSPGIAQINTIADCPDIGVGGDSMLNHVKNKTDSPNATAVANHTLSWIGNITQPATWHKNQSRSSLSAHEGKAIQVQAYVLKVTHYPSGAESCNCSLTGEANNDFHLVLGSTKTTLEENSITAEMTPRVRLNHPNWTFNKLKDIKTAKTKVRITGWLMLDTQHISHPINRKTNWEIHSVTKFEVKQSDGTWKSLDD
jgi:hypothetical protein